jgi:hypothetical protein
MALYSGLDSLSTKGRFYVLGFNPADKGGNYTRLGDEKFKHGNWSAYFDQCWHLNDGVDCCDCAKNRRYKPFQKKLQKLLRALHGTDDALQVRKTFSTNAIFLASSTPSALGNKEQLNALWAMHWPIHREFLKLVSPDYIIALGYQDGNSPYSLLRKELRGANEQIAGARAKWKAFRVQKPFWKAPNDDSHTYVVGFYHPSWPGHQTHAWEDFLSHTEQGPMS